MNWVEQRLYNRYVLTGNNRWLWFYHVITFVPIIGWGISGVIAIVTENVKEWIGLTLILMIIVLIGILVFLTSMIIKEKKRDWESKSK